MPVNPYTIMANAMLVPYATMCVAWINFLGRFK